MILAASKFPASTGWLLAFWLVAGAYAFVEGIERNRLGLAVLGAVMYGSIVAVAVVRATGWA